MPFQASLVLKGFSTQVAFESLIRMNLQVPFQNDLSAEAHSTMNTFELFLSMTVEDVLGQIAFSSESFWTIFTLKRFLLEEQKLKIVTLLVYLVGMLIQCTEFLTEWMTRCC